MESDPNSTIRIESAGREAEAQIRAMIRAGRLNPLGIDWRRFLLAIGEDGEIVGCVQVKQHRGGARELASLFVKPASRRRGVGGSLIRQVLGQEDPPLWLTCRVRLVAYYERFGFQVVDDVRDMPGYFRFAWRVFNFIPSRTRGEARLAVMRWR
jgi:predicted N-acetyltransferase YhbS